MPSDNARFVLHQAELSRRRVMQATGGVAAAGLAGRTASVFAQATPDATPAATPQAGAERDVESWFVVSAQNEGGGFTTSADIFEVYSGVTLEKLGGFRSPGTVGMCVTADPARIILATTTGAAVFDLRTGKVREIDLNGGAFSGPAWLPDPRIFPIAPPRWAVLRATDYSQCWLVDLADASAVDLTAIIAKRGNGGMFPVVTFSPDGTMAAARVDAEGAVLFDPEQPDDFRRLDGGVTGAVAGAPLFSASGEHIVYTVAESNQAVDARVVIESVADGEIVAEIGGLSATVFAAFLPGSESTILLLGDGESIVIDTLTGRDLIDVESAPLAYGYGFSSDGNLVLSGASELSGEEMRWQKLDLTTGEAEDIPELEALTFYNSSYGGADVVSTLFGPPYLSQGEEVVDALVGFDTETMTATPLLDDVSSWDLSYGYSTSADSGIALFVAYDAMLMNLVTGEVRTFPDITTGASSRGSFVSPDGSKAAISAWDSGPGTQTVLMIDVAAGGDPEPFVDGVLWLWAGAVPEVVSGANRGITSGGVRWSGLRTIGRR